MPSNFLAMMAFGDQPTFTGAAIVWLIEVAMKATLILIVATLLAAALRSSTARLRHTVWSLSLLGVLALPLLSAWLPSWNVPLLPTPAAKNVSVVAPSVAVFASPEAPSIQVSEAMAGNPSTWPLGALGVWLGGMMAVLAWTLLGHLRVASLSRQAHPLTDDGWCLAVSQAKRAVATSKRIAILGSRYVCTPMTWGFHRPVVLMPMASDSWSCARRRTVLMHEMTHIVRGDWPLQLAAHLACAAHWFNPLCWLAARRLRIEQELACDEDVIAQGCRPSEYATHLLAVARDMAHPVVVPVTALAMSSSTRLEGRLSSILARPDTTRRGSCRASGLLVIGFGVLMAIAALQPWYDSDARAKTLRHERLADARTMVADGRHREAVSAFAAIAEDAPESARAWFDLGEALRFAGRIEDAIAAFRKAASLCNRSELQGASLYQVARGHAKNGETQLALDALEEAVAAGYDEPSIILNEADLRSLHGTRRFRELVAKLKGYGKPGRSAPERPTVLLPLRAC